MDELVHRIEALLFASGKGLPVKTLCEYTDESEKKILKCLKDLQDFYEENNGALVITNREDVWKLTVRGKFVKDVEHLASETELPPAILKTLAVVAYKSPVLQADIIHMRGQSAYDHIKVLAKQKLITKDEEGRSYLLKITDKFYNYFDVEGDAEIREVFEKLRATQPKQTLGTLQVVDATDFTNEPVHSLSPQIQEAPKVGDLEVVEVAPVRKSDEDRSFEHEYLDTIDTRIQELAKRIHSHELPKKEEKEEDEEQFL